MLHALAIASLVVAAICAITIAADIFVRGHRQPMAVMEIVWPVTALLVAALKADSLSLTAWQVGMYGWMAIATFLVFGNELGKLDPVFWLMMQLAMIASFLASYPVSRWLIRKGIKESM